MRWAAAQFTHWLISPWSTTEYNPTKFQQCAGKAAKESAVAQYSKIGHSEPYLHANDCCKLAAVGCLLRPDWRTASIFYLKETWRYFTIALIFLKKIPNRSHTLWGQNLCSQAKLISTPLPSQ